MKKILLIIMCLLTVIVMLTACFEVTFEKACEKVEDKIGNEYGRCTFEVTEYSGVDVLQITMYTADFGYGEKGDYMAQAYAQSFAEKYETVFNKHLGSYDEECAVVLFIYTPIHSISPAYYGKIWNN